MNLSHDVPVLIVGAGPTGLTAALELSRLGISVRIVDRAPERCLTSRALGIQARTVELLRVRGVGDELVRLGNPARATSQATMAMSPTRMAVPAASAVNRVGSPPEIVPSVEPINSEIAEVTAMVVCRELQNSQKTSPPNMHA
jgi:2-polyprenyl-6-methoxyphenol hydroxylase-like FAD-dependent oxidoreductase